MKKLIATLIFGSFAVTAHAEGLYGGLSYGQTDYDSPGFSDGSGFGFKLGYQINENFAIEGGYLDGGEGDDNDGADSWYLDGDAVQLALKASTNINEPVFGYLKLGYASWDLELDASNTGGGRDSIDGNDLLYGAGVGWNFNEAGRAYLEYQTISVDTDDADGDVATISVGVEFKF